MFNTSRQIGGALAIARFGALLGGEGRLLHGLRYSLVLAAIVALAAAASSATMRPTAGRSDAAFMEGIGA